nr:uncharacterized protein LOC120973658 [Aegilops tauschii subsp. strangulata]
MRSVPSEAARPGRAVPKEGSHQDQSSLELGGTRWTCLFWSPSSLLSILPCATQGRSVRLCGRSSLPFLQTSHGVDSDDDRRTLVLAGNMALSCSRRRDAPRHRPCPATRGLLLCFQGNQVALPELDESSPATTMHHSQQGDRGSHAAVLFIPSPDWSSDESVMLSFSCKVVMYHTCRARYTCRACKVLYYTRSYVLARIELVTVVANVLLDLVALI